MIYLWINIHILVTRLERLLYKTKFYLLLLVEPLNLLINFIGQDLRRQVRSNSLLQIDTKFQATLTIDKSLTLVHY